MEERGFGTVRYGGKLGTNASYRVYGKFADRDEFTRIDGRGAGDGWWLAQEGFRVDWEPSEINRLTLQGDYYSGELDTPIRRPAVPPPGIILNGITETAEGEMSWGVGLTPFPPIRSCRCRCITTAPTGISAAREIRDTVDVDAQHRFHIGERQEIVWGGGYRYSVDDIRDSPDFKMRDPQVGLQLGSAFVQDEITLVPDRWRVTLGTKLEHHDFTGFEVQPNVRVA